jgi:ABC-type sugar transport system ATPase subunit
LSGGQQQRIALARALASEPALVLFDEPLSSLDALLREDLRRQLRAIHRETKFTGVYVTHDQTEAMSLGTRVAVMNAGRVEQIGTPPQIYGEPASEFVAAFMGMSNVIERPGEAGKIRFRPEDVTVSFAPMSGIPNTECQRIVVPAKVLDCAFQGEWTECSLESDRGPIKAKVPVQSQSFTAGDSVLVAVPVEKARRF